MLKLILKMSELEVDILSLQIILTLMKEITSYTRHYDQHIRNNVSCKTELLLILIFY